MSIYSEYCFDRLPCGVCRLTNKLCPLGNSNSNDLNPLDPLVPTCFKNSTSIATTCVEGTSETVVEFGKKEKLWDEVDL